MEFWNALFVGAAGFLMGFALGGYLTKSVYERFGTKKEKRCNQA